MRTILPLVLVASTVLCQAQDTITVGALERTYTVRLPSAYDGNTPLPLVIAMHGGFGSGTQLENQSQLTVKAEQEGFIVVYPDGVPSPINIRTWNAGGCCGYAMNNNIDDVGFIDALLDRLEADYAVDTQRVYATGMSNGGFMSYRLACELSERIAAIAPVSASMNIALCEPARPVPVLAMHSYQDSSVPYLGGVGDGVSNHYNSPLDSVLTAFALHADCAVLRDTLQDNAEMTVVQWRECDCGKEMLLYLTQDGGHSWHGGQGTGIGDPPSSTISANELMWSFFQQYTVDCFSTSVEELPAQEMLLAPNPTTGPLTITGSTFVGITVLDLSGRVVQGHGLAPTTQSTVDLSALGAGVYLLQLQKPGGERVGVRVQKW